MASKPLSSKTMQVVATEMNYLLHPGFHKERKSPLEEQLGDYGFSQLFLLDISVP